MVNFSNGSFNGPVDQTSSTPISKAGSCTNEVIKNLQSSNVFTESEKQLIQGWSEKIDILKGSGICENLDSSTHLFDIELRKKEDCTGDNREYGSFESIDYDTLDTIREKVREYFSINIKQHELFIILMMLGNKKIYSLGFSTDHQFDTIYQLHIMGNYNKFTYAD